MRSTFHITCYFFLLLGGLACWSACQQQPLGTAYIEEIEAWRMKRLASLKSPTGWPTLAGLFWIDEGRNSIGHDSDSDIRLPQGMPDHMGTVSLDSGKIIFEVDPSLGIKVGDTQFTGGEVHTDQSGSPEVFSWKQFSWYFIERGDRYGLRLRDSLHPARIALDEIPYFPISKSYIFSAVYSPPVTGQTISIQNVIGLISEDPVAGKLSFLHKNKEYELTALNGGPESLWLIFSDETTGKESYGGGRYLYCPKPDSNGVVMIDFNRAYNPPCAFTDYATCPLPPKENHLGFKVKAGEKNYHHD